LNNKGTLNYPIKFNYRLNRSFRWKKA